MTYGVTPTVIERESGGRRYQCVVMGVHCSSNSPRALAEMVRFRGGSHISYNTSFGDSFENPRPLNAFEVEMMEEVFSDSAISSLT